MIASSLAFVPSWFGTIRSFKGGDFSNLMTVGSFCEGLSSFGFSRVFGNAVGCPIRMG